jgi:hypothetical protein
MTIRWKQQTAPELGDERTVTRFLLFPKCLGDEWRWLGREQIVQVYSEFYGPGGYVSGWYSVRWAR